MTWMSYKTWKCKKREREQWHTWFAWRPVTVKSFADGVEEKVWLKTVLRCGKYQCDYGDGCWTWRYKKLACKVDA